jgi:wobble nucleotide-excising tRNase
MRITDIQIKNFRGFHKAHPINLHSTGKNAIIYGENGSGKSSLFLALKQFLSSYELSHTLADHRNIFADPSDSVHIKITLTNGNPPYEWSESVIQTNAPEILAGYKFSGFLEYRDILKTHTLAPNNNQVNLFDLLVLTLLADIENPFTTPRQTFSQHWATIQTKLPKDNRYKRDITALNQELQQFNDGLNALLQQLEAEMTAIFAYFEYGKVKLTFEPVSCFYNLARKAIDGQKLMLTVEFANKNLQGQHPNYLNEAKLSAIGIAIYLAALKLKPLPAGDLAILVLDDVLIGLDMSNRLPIIDIIESHFIPNYQIFLMTYDREWFEILCEHFVDPNRASWKAFEFYCADDDELELPIFAERTKGRDEYIQRAEKYFQAHDYKASAVYARSACEAILKFFCNKKGVPVPYQDKPKNLKIDQMWTAVKNYKKNDGTDYVDSKTAIAIDKAIKKVLNPLSHSRPVSVYRREVQYAICAVKRLYSQLK